MDYRNEEPISEKIAIAKRLHAALGDELKMDPQVSVRLEELSVRVKDSSELCLSSGLGEACRICEQDEGGSCCGEGIENRYSPELLLINLLLGVTLPESRKCSRSCYFLGEVGCTLQVREILCINYLCGKLQKTFPPEILRRLQEVNGAEMDLIFGLHDRVKTFVRQKDM
ncbi:MAG: hypothetical protein P4L55_16395 [Syntrophobacteraceae bacterium]|nr:hypothetical protein [Syntrophobacteraceae bacterium]